MLIYALVAFGGAALLGLILAGSVLRGQLAPWAVSLLHAAFGATGLVLLLLTVLDGARGNVLWALIILAAAALGGFLLASFHLRKVVAPGILVVIHAGAAVAGVVCLVLAVLNEMQA